MELKLKKIGENVRVDATTTGLQLFATNERIDLRGGYIEYRTGVAIDVPVGFEAQVRSSNIIDKDIILVDSLGVNDKQEIVIRFKPIRYPNARKYSVGDSVASIVMVPIAQMDTVNVLEVSDLA